MGIPVFIMGESGSGKSYSLKHMDPDKVGVFSVKKDRLPFREGKNFKIMKQSTYQSIASVLSGAANRKTKTYVVDDSQYLMSDEFMSKINDTGYQKYTAIAVNFNGLIQYIITQLPDNVIVFFMHHVETSEQGKVKVKTVGKMLDNFITLEGLVDICIFCKAEGTKHLFITQSDGSTTAKSPEDMLDNPMPNDLAEVEKRIREYYGIELEGGE